MDLKSEIGLKIKQRRKELGLEQGKGNITLASLEKLINVLGLECSLVIKG